MYEEYFGLERPPFKITPDTSLFFEGGKRGDILDALVYAIHRGEGIIKVVGEVGSGKTMLCRMLQLKLPDTIEIVYIANPSVSPEDILFVIAHELSLPVTRDATKHEVMHQLHDYLLQRHMENRQVVLFVEEAQGMPLDTLEEIRLLSNLETDQNKLLQIILFGQPELDQNLAQQSIRQLRERITHNFELDPLSPDEIHNYLNFRLRQVGYTGPEIINRSVAKKIEQHSAGLLRRINIIADKLLLSAFAEGTHDLGAKHVTAAVNDSTFDDKVKTKSGHLTWLGLIVAMALAFGLYQSQPMWVALIQPDSPNQSVLSVETTEPAGLTAETAEPVKPNAREAEMAELAGQTGQAPANSQSKVESASVENEMVASEPQIQQAAAGAVTDGEAATGVAEFDAEEISAIAADELSRLDETPLLDELLDDPRPAGPSSDDAREMSAGPEAGGSTAPASEAAELAMFDMASDYEDWLDAKLQESREWLRQAPRDNVSIQVMMRNKSAERELVEYLRNEWPLDLSKTYLYEVNFENQKIYRVFYSEFNTMTSGRHHIERLPESVKSNSPYLNSVYRMRKTLL